MTPAHRSFRAHSKVTNQFKLVMKGDLGDLGESRAKQRAGVVRTVYNMTAKNRNNGMADTLFYDRLVRSHVAVSTSRYAAIRVKKKLFYYGKVDLTVYICK
jgi:hypothetical protein